VPVFAKFNVTPSLSNNIAALHHPSSLIERPIEYFAKKMLMMHQRVASLGPRHGTV
jgi:hypothetical protein